MAITHGASEPKEQEYKVLEPGEYPVEVVDATEGKTAQDGPKLKAGTPKIDLKLRVNDEATVYDNLFFSTNTNWKVDAFLKSIGTHPGEGNEIEIDAFDLVGARGMVRVTKGKTKAGQPKNEVGGYIWEKF